MAKRKTPQPTADATEAPAVKAAPTSKYQYLGPKRRLAFPSLNVSIEGWKLSDAQIEALTDKYPTLRQYFLLRDKGSKDE